MIPKLAFIGTGIMGGPMACNLRKAGFAVCVHNRTRAKAQAAIDAGASWADTPAQAACNADVVFTCLPDSPDVEKVLLGLNGAIHSAKAGTICVDHSTISPKVTIEIAEALEEKGIVLLDAPVSGGQKGAIEGKLSIMVGGPKEALDKVRSILSAMGKTITHCGPAGSGQLTKLTNQIMVIQTVLSAAEGLAFAKSAGLNMETTLEAITAGAGSSRSLVNLGPKMIAGDFAPAFKVDLQLKDLRLIQETAGQIGQPLPITALATELLHILAAHGRGSDGTQALYDLVLSFGRK